MVAVKCCSGIYKSDCVEKHLEDQKPYADNPDFVAKCICGSPLSEMILTVAMTPEIVKKNFAKREITSNDTNLKHWFEVCNFKQRDIGNI